MPDFCVFPYAHIQPPTLDIDAVVSDKKCVCVYVRIFNFLT